MVPTRKKKQQNKRSFNQLSEDDTDFMIARNSCEILTENRTNMADKGISSNNVNGPTQVNSSQVVMHTLEENIIIKVRSEVDSVMTTVETRIQDAVLTAMENLVIPRVKLAMKSAHASSERSVDGNVVEPNQREFSKKFEGLQMTASIE